MLRSLLNHCPRFHGLLRLYKILLLQIYWTMDVTRKCFFRCGLMYMGKCCKQYKKWDTQRVFWCDKQRTKLFAVSLHWHRIESPWPGVVMVHVCRYVCMRIERNHRAWDQSLHLDCRLVREKGKFVSSYPFGPRPYNYTGLHGRTMETSESVLWAWNTSWKQIWNMITFPASSEMGGTEVSYIGWWIITT